MSQLPRSSKYLKDGCGISRRNMNLLLFKDKDGLGMPHKVLIFRIHQGFTTGWRDEIFIESSDMSIFIMDERLNSNFYHRPSPPGRNGWDEWERDHHVIVLDHDGTGSVRFVMTLGNLWSHHPFLYIGGPIFPMEINQPLPSWCSFHVPTCSLLRFPTTSRHDAPERDDSQRRKFMRRSLPDNSTSDLFHGKFSMEHFPPMIGYPYAQGHWWNRSNCWCPSMFFHIIFHVIYWPVHYIVHCFPYHFPGLVDWIMLLMPFKWDHLQMDHQWYQMIVNWW